MLSMACNFAAGRKNNDERKKAEPPTPATPAPHSNKGLRLFSMTAILDNIYMTQKL